MGSPVNAQILHVWEVKDGAGAAITGLSGTMTATLTRFPTTSSSEAATETVSIAEIGSTGLYAITYTPTLAYTYKGRITESTLFLEFTFEDDVDDAPSTASAANAYCTEADVVSFAQMGDYTASTRPTESEVLGFMQMRAAEIYGELAKWMGASAPGPSSYSLTIDTGSDAGVALSYQCRLANALGAAMDALEAAGANEQPAQGGRVKELGTAFTGVMSGLKNLALLYVGFGSRAATHISTGEVQLPSTSPITAQPLPWSDRSSW